MFKAPDHQGTSYISSFNPPTKQKKRKKKKKNKQPKSWKFEDRIKKVTDNELVHIDWDAPPMHSPYRDIRQSWTIYNDPDDISAKYNSQKSGENVKPHSTIEKSRFKKQVNQEQGIGKVIQQETKKKVFVDTKGTEVKKVIVSNGEKKVMAVKVDAEKKLGSDSSCRFIDSNKHFDVNAYNSIDSGKAKLVESKKVDEQATTKITLQAQAVEKPIETVKEKEENYVITVHKTEVDSIQNKGNDNRKIEVKKKIVETPTLKNIKISGIKKISLLPSAHKNSDMKSSTIKTIQSPTHTVDKNKYKIQVKNINVLQPEPTKKIITSNNQTVKAQARQTSNQRISRYTSPSPRIIRRSRNPSQVTKKVELSSPNPKLIASKKEFTKTKINPKSEYYRANPQANQMVYIDSKMHRKNDMPKRGTIFSKSGYEVNRQKSENSKILKNLQMSVIGQASNNHSSFFNNLSKGKTKFGIVSDKDAANLRHTVPVKPKQRVLRSPYHYNPSLSNARPLGSLTGNKNTSVQVNGSQRKIIKTRDPQMYSGSLRPVFHSRPPSIGKASLVKGTSVSKKRQFKLDLTNINQENGGSDRDQPFYGRQHNIRGPGSNNPTNDHKGFQSSRVISKYPGLTNGVSLNQSKNSKKLINYTRRSNKKYLFSLIKRHGRVINKAYKLPCEDSLRQHRRQSSCWLATGNGS